ncbi:MAG TPA: hypothetical protein VGH91_11975 [Gammaproteobacteria bacterium]|jgi:hypothetical protein
MEEQRQFRVSPQVYRNNLAALGLFLCITLLIGSVSVYSFNHHVLVACAVLAFLAILLGYSFRWLPRLKQIIVLDERSIACISGPMTTRLAWNEIGSIRGAFNASDIVVCDRDSKPVFAIFRSTEGFQVLVNVVLQHVAPMAIGSNSRASGIRIEDGCVVLELAKESRRVPLRDITGLRMEYDSRPTALAKLVIECAGTQVPAVNIANYILDAYGTIRRAMESHG